MKRILTIAAAVLVLAGCAQENKKAESLQPLKVEGTTLCYEDGTPAVFRGISFGWHNLWPRFYNKEAVKNVAAQWNTQIVRAAIGADDLHETEDNSGYISNPDRAMECLYNVVDGAIEAGVYVIVDWHSHVIHTEEAKEFFTQVATRYKGVPNVIYELFNEPVCRSFETEFSYADLGDADLMKAYWQDLKAYAEELIKVITDIDDSHPLIMMGCPSWDQRIDLVADDPITCYDNLMYTVHFYAATHKKELRDASDYAISRGIPVFISECGGCEASGNGPIDEESMKEWSDWAAANGISILMWSISDKDETCSMFTPDATSEGPWPEDVIKPWGRMAMSIIGK